MSRSGKYWGSVAALVVLAAVAGCAPAESKLDRGLETMRRESTPTELSARGEAFAALGDMTRAEQYFVAALKAGGEPGALVRRLVAVCVADGRYPVAIEYAEDYLRNHPRDVDVRYVTGTLRAALGDASGAKEELRAVLAAKPNLADAHYALAQIARTEGDVMGADAAFRQYLRLEPAGRHAEAARENLMQTVPQ
ncbi:MAG: tetratricopeptide repeat protein [Labilithrix sp.]|nr:tetratricopeptide repeat protein [Labilithrix sp.]